MHFAREVVGFGSNPDLFSSGDETRTGWTIGGGIEVALGGNWSAKGEYNFMSFGKDSVDFTGTFSQPAIDIDQDIHVVKFGLNYRFGPSPVARY